MKGYRPFCGLGRGGFCLGGGRRWDLLDGSENHCD